MQHRLRNAAGVQKALAHTDDGEKLARKPAHVEVHNLARAVVLADVGVEVRANLPAVQSLEQ
eukprot:10613255-Lingulodinium_polyedra.AAC.1